MKVWCLHCQDHSSTVFDHDTHITSCENCGRLIDQEIYIDAPTFVKDNRGQSRLAGSVISSLGDYVSSRERTLKKGKEEILSIINSLDMGGGTSTVNAAHRFYVMAVDKNFTRGRRTSYVAATCLYLHCRCDKQPYLLIDFSDSLQISVYVLGACFLELCNLLRLADHPIIQRLVDPSLFIHRFTYKLLGKYHDGVSETALHIVASMKRDWIQTGRKPSGICGAALYISALSHGFNFTKSDVVTVVHICEATLTKRLIEFENTESGGLTIDEFLARAKELDIASRENQRPRPGEVLCEHKGEAHFAHGLCRICFNDLDEISGGLDGGAEPPAFRCAEIKRMMEQEKQKDKNKESSIDETEAGISQVDLQRTKQKLLASKEREEAGHNNIDSSANGEDNEFKTQNQDGENLSDIDDVEVEMYLHNEEETRLKKIIWEEMNKEYLEEQAAKEAAAVNWELNGGEKAKKKRKRRTTEDGKNYGSALEATSQMLKKKPFSSRVNYEALGSLYTSEQEKAKELGAKEDTNQDEVSTLEDVDYFEEIDLGDDENTGEDGDYAYKGSVFDEEVEEA